MALSLTPLSKSRYLAGLQCRKRLFWEVHRRDLLPLGVTSTGVQALLDTGSDVGRLARTRYPGGVLIEQDHLGHEEAVAATKKAMADPAVPAIFEGAFTYDATKIRVDILVRQPGDRWYVQEVKSTTGMKGIHLPDLAVQVHVLLGSRVRVSLAGVLQLNRDYVLGPDGLDVSRLFQFAIPMGGIKEHVTKARETLPQLLAVLQSDGAPEVEPGEHCHSPYECPFIYLCCPKKGPYDLEQLPRGGKLAARLAEAGIDDVRAVPADTKMRALQRRVLESIATGREHVGPGLRAPLVRVGFPIAFLDFEAFQPAIPRYVGTTPYTSLPTQWSLHRLSLDGQLVHAEFLHDADTDPRLHFAESLLAALEGDDGAIVVYSPYEATQIKSLAKQFPLLQERLLAILPRILDLLLVIRRHYYHPDFGGSFSIKNVLPVLVPALSYDDLAVQDGLAAAAEYARMIDPTTSPAERAKVRESLLRYCERDTLALVKVREALLARCGRN